MVPFLLSNSIHSKSVNASLTFVLSQKLKMSYSNDYNFLTELKYHIVCFFNESSEQAQGNNVQQKEMEQGLLPGHSGEVEQH